MVLTTTADKSFPNFQLRNGDLAFIYMMESLTWELAAQGTHLPTDKLTLVDVGAGGMTYGLALETWAHNTARQVRIIAVDPEYASPDRKGLFLPPRASNGKSCIEQVTMCVEEALLQLRKIGVDKVDLLTLFNPDPNPETPFPNLRSLDELCRNVSVVGALHVPFPQAIDRLTGELAKQGYRVITRPNHTSQHMTGYTHSFDPMFAAIPK